MIMIDQLKFSQQISDAFNCLSAIAITEEFGDKLAKVFLLIFVSTTLIRWIIFPNWSVTRIGALIVGYSAFKEFFKQKHQHINRPVECALSTRIGSWIPFSGTECPHKSVSELADEFYHNFIPLDFLNDFTVKKIIAPIKTIADELLTCYDDLVGRNWFGKIFAYTSIPFAALVFILISFLIVWKLYVVACRWYFSSPKLVQTKSAKRKRQRRSKTTQNSSSNKNSMSETFDSAASTSSASLTSIVTGLLSNVSLPVRLALTAVSAFFGLFAWFAKSFIRMIEGDLNTENDNEEEIEVESSEDEEIEFIEKSVCSSCSKEVNSEPNNKCLTSPQSPNKIPSTDGPKGHDFEIPNYTFSKPTALGNSYSNCTINVVIHKYTDSYKPKRSRQTSRPKPYDQMGRKSIRKRKTNSQDNRDNLE